MNAASGRCRGAAIECRARRLMLIRKHARATRVAAAASSGDQVPHRHELQRPAFGATGHARRDTALDRRTNRLSVDVSLVPCAGRLAARRALAGAAQATGLRRPTDRGDQAWQPSGPRTPGNTGTFNRQGAAPPQTSCRPLNLSTNDARPGIPATTKSATRRYKV